MCGCAAQCMRYDAWLAMCAACVVDIGNVLVWNEFPGISEWRGMDVETQEDEDGKKTKRVRGTAVRGKCGFGPEKVELQLEPRLFRVKLT